MSYKGDALIGGSDQIKPERGDVSGGDPGSEGIWTERTGIQAGGGGGTGPCYDPVWPIPHG